MCPKDDSFDFQVLNLTKKILCWLS